MKTLHDHLGADQDVSFARTKLLEEGFMGVFLFGSIAVDAKSADLGIDGLKSAFDMFCSEAFIFEVFCMITGGAGSWRERFVRAAMAREDIFFFVEG